MSDLQARLAPFDSTFTQFLAAAEYVGAARPLGSAALNRWCDLRYARSSDRAETMADLLAAGAVSEAEVRACFGEAA